MKHQKDKRHWYDGWIYDRLLAPNQKGSFDLIASLVNDGASIIDIGCGTGRLSYKLAEKCSHLTGIDLSYINIATALSNLEEKHADKVSFIHSSLEDFTANNNKLFDYAILSYVVHEVNKYERAALLKNASLIADKIIIADHIPETKLLAGAIREVLEFFAGREHYSSYKSFINNGGIRRLAEATGLIIEHEEIFRSHLHIAVLVKNK